MYCCSHCVFCTALTVMCCHQAWVIVNDLRLIQDEDLITKVCLFGFIDLFATFLILIVVIQYNLVWLYDAFPISTCLCIADSSDSPEPPGKAESQVSSSTGANEYSYFQRQVFSSCSDMNQWPTGHVTWWQLWGPLVGYPLAIAKSRQYIWRLGTRRWDIRVPSLQMSSSDLT